MGNCALSDVKESLISRNVFLTHFINCGQGNEMKRSKKSNGFTFLLNGWVCVGGAGQQQEWCCQKAASA